MRVELVYENSCPNVANARLSLRESFDRVGIEPQWTEWDRDDPDAPAYPLRFGSPTILVNGRDLEDQSADGTQGSCRIYLQEDGRFRGVPPVSVIVRALERAVAEDGGGRRLSGWRRTLAVLPAAGVAFIPVGVCPACWPLLAGLLSALGLGFLLQTAYVLPVALLLIAFSLLALGYRARARRGFGPLVMGAAGGLALAAGKFLVVSAALDYAGLLLLVAASIWNTWPRRSPGSSACPRCASAATSPGSPDS